MSSNNNTQERLAVIETKIDNLTETLDRRFKLQEKVETKQNDRIEKLELNSYARNKFCSEKFADKRAVEELSKMLLKIGGAIILLLIGIVGFLLRIHLFK